MNGIFPASLENCPKDMLVILIEELIEENNVLKWQRDFQEDKATYNNCKDNSVTLYSWLDEWLEIYVKPTVKHHTYLTYYYSIQHIKAAQPDCMLKDVKEILCQQILNLMSRSLYARSTILKVKILLKRAFSVAVRNQIIVINPAEQLVLPQASVKRVVSLTQSEQLHVEAACSHVTNGHLARFLLLTGLRASELCALEWEHYDEEKQYIKIIDSKTAAGIRIVPLVRAAVDIVLAQPKINEFIFNSTLKTPITITVLKRVYERLRKETGINKITNHVYRHSFATRAMERKMNVKALSVILGHTDVAFTLKTYTTAEEKFLCEQMAVME